MDPARARALLANFAQARVLVLGDLMLDHYVWGDVDRISPEAPIPVVRVDHESTMLGGAGNVGRNLASLGAQVQMVSLVGEDAAAEDLEHHFQDWKIDAGGLVCDASRPTTQKTRVIARGQQVVRYDRETDDPISSETVQRVLAELRERAGSVDGVVIEDYGKGFLVRDLLREAMTVFGERGVRVFVDPKLPPWDVFRGAELLKPNAREAEQVTGIRMRGPEQLERVGAALLEQTGVHTVAITRGAEGMTLFPRGGPSAHYPAQRRAVADAAGAGDTAIAVLALARLSGGDWAEAATLANAAGSYVVGVRGTATLTPGDLLGALERES
jgi:D-beta-D-heptose 7-phosphate kinase/D-beta-D-heptose 1-phosphate adenosyltransferase